MAFPSYRIHRQFYYLLRRSLCRYQQGYHFWRACWSLCDVRTAGNTISIVKLSRVRSSTGLHIRTLEISEEKVLSMWLRFPVVEISSLPYRLTTLLCDALFAKSKRWLFYLKDTLGTGYRGYPWQILVKAIVFTNHKCQSVIAFFCYIKRISDRANLSLWTS